MGAQSWDALWSGIDTAERVLTLRPEDGWRSTAEMAERWRVTVSRAAVRLREMVNAGTLERTRGRVQGRGVPGWYFRPAQATRTPKVA